MERKTEKVNIGKMLSDYAYHNGVGASKTFDDFLDFFIELFDTKHYIDNDFEKNLFAKSKENPTFMDCVISVMNEISTAIEMGAYADPLGIAYEQCFQSKMKASGLGQFYTPLELCRLMSDITESYNGESVYDPACGSGRTLIVSRLMEMEHGKQLSSAEYVGEDIDFVSVKMCAINMMLYGCRGHVTRKDTLNPYGHNWQRYEINEVRYPFFCNAYSIRTTLEYVPDAHKKEVKKNKVVKEVEQLELDF